MDCYYCSSADSSGEFPKICRLRMQGLLEGTYYTQYFLSSKFVSRHARRSLLFLLCLSAHVLRDSQRQSKCWNLILRTVSSCLVSILPAWTYSGGDNCTASTSDKFHSGLMEVFRIGNVILVTGYHSQYSIDHY